jgi:hypothetical protein
MKQITLYLTDNSGRKLWRTTVSYGYHQGEQNNLERHLKAIKAQHPHYRHNLLDPHSARLVCELDGKEANHLLNITPADQQLLDDLFNDIL